MNYFFHLFILNKIHLFNMICLFIYSSFYLFIYSFILKTKNLHCHVMWLRWAPCYTPGEGWFRNIYTSNDVAHTYFLIYYWLTYFLSPFLLSSETTQSQAKDFWLVFDGGLNISTIRASFSFLAAALILSDLLSEIKIGSSSDKLSKLFLNLDNGSLQTKKGWIF